MGGLPDDGAAKVVGGGVVVRWSMGDVEVGGNGIGQLPTFSLTQFWIGIPG